MHPSGLPQSTRIPTPSKLVSHLDSAGSLNILIMALGTGCGYLGLMSRERLLTVFVSASSSILLSTAVTWFLGPMEVIRQEKARRRLDLRRRLTHAIRPLLLQLHNDELQRRLLEEGGQMIMPASIREYERLLRPVVSELDNPDMPALL